MTALQVPPQIKHIKKTTPEWDDKQLRRIALVGGAPLWASILQTRFEGNYHKRRAGVNWTQFEVILEHEKGCNPAQAGTALRLPEKHTERFGLYQQSDS